MNLSVRTLAALFVIPLMGPALREEKIMFRLQMLGVNLARVIIQTANGRVDFCLRQGLFENDGCQVINWPCFPIGFTACITELGY
jgi:hypothetical protein